MAIDLTPKQMLKLAEIIHLQEVEKLYELMFNDYGQQQNYLQGCKQSYDNTRDLLNDIQAIKDKAEAENDAAKISIFQHSTTFIATCLQLIPSYDTRLIFLAKFTDLIKQLDSATQIEEATRLANQAAIYKDYVIDYAKILDTNNPEAEAGDLSFRSGSKVKPNNGLTVCQVAPMAAGIGLARLVKHNYPDL